MIDIVTTFPIKQEGSACIINLFGRINESNRTFDLHYELDSNSDALTRPGALLGQTFNMRVKSTSAQIYIVYDCTIISQSLAFSGSGMGTVSGRFDRLIKQNHSDDTYDKMMFSFDGIEHLFPLINFQIDMPRYDGPLTISRPALEEKEHSVTDSISGSIVSDFGSISSEPISEIHISQKKHIVLSFTNKQTACELIKTLTRVKQYIEFLCSREIQLSDIQFSSSDPNNWKSAEVISDPILIPCTFIKPIESDPYGFSEEDFFAGLQGWLNHVDKYSRVIDIWKKTIYNSNVSAEDLFIWRCQAFELLCTLTEEIKESAKKKLVDDQSYPNIRNYLCEVNSRYDIADFAESHFSKTKVIRDILTHNNPDKTASDEQFRNAYTLIHYFLVASIGEIMDFKCRRPGLILTSI